MQHSMTSYRYQQGFTLLEIMIVVTLIALITTSVKINFGFETEAEKAEKQVLRFHGVMNAAAEYAMLNQVELGMKFEDNEYEFLAFDGQKWRPMSGQKIFEPQELSEFIDMKLELEGLEWSEGNLLGRVTWVDEDADEDDEEKLTPQLFFLSSGEITPFLLTFEIDDEEDEPLFYQFKGEFSVPITIEGPLEDRP